MTSPEPTPQINAHALQIGDRINTAGFEGDVLSSTPLAVRVGGSGLAIVFRYGVVVFLGMSPEEEKAFLERLSARAFGTDHAARGGMGQSPGRQGGGRADPRRVGRSWSAKCRWSGC